MNEKKKITRMCFSISRNTKAPLVGVIFRGWKREKGK